MMMLGTPVAQTARSTGEDPEITLLLASGKLSRPNRLHQAVLEIDGGERTLYTVGAFACSS